MGNPLFYFYKKKKKFFFLSIQMTQVAILFWIKYSCNDESKNKNLQNKPPITMDFTQE